MLPANGVVNTEVWEYSPFRDTVTPITPPEDLKSITKLDKTVLQRLQPALPKHLLLINFLNCITVHTGEPLLDCNRVFIYCSDCSVCCFIGILPGLILC